MKRFLLILGIIAVVGTIAFAATFQVNERVRWAGSSTLSSDYYYFVVDSSDTFECDTLYSDTVTIDSLAKWLVIDFSMAGYLKCDSCNDSMLTIVLGYTAYNGAFKTLILTDTLPATLGTLDSTAASTKFYHSLDSTIANEFWFETIYKDSVITTVSDSAGFQMQYKVGQKAVEKLYQ